MYMFALLKTIGKGPNYPPGNFYAADLYQGQRLFLWKLCSNAADFFDSGLGPIQSQEGFGVNEPKIQ